MNIRIAAEKGVVYKMFHSYKFEKLSAWQAATLEICRPIVFPMEQVHS